MMYEDIIIEKPETPKPPSDSDDDINEYIKVKSNTKETIISKPMNVKRLGKEETIKLLMKENDINKTKHNKKNNKLNNTVYTILGSSLLLASSVSLGIIMSYNK